MRKFLANLLALVMMFSIFAMNNSTAEAKAHITWKTTQVTLNFKKVVVNGYFENDGDALGKVKEMKLVIDVRTKDGQSLYSTVNSFKKFDEFPAHVYPGKKVNYWFSVSDKDCPRYDSEKIDWAVKYDIVYE